MEKHISMCMFMYFYVQNHMIITVTKCIMKWHELELPNGDRYQLRGQRHTRGGQNMLLNGFILFLKYSTTVKYCIQLFTSLKQDANGGYYPGGCCRLSDRPSM